MHLAREAVGSGGADRITQTSQVLVELHETFGMRSALRFRYVHDFLYGYDWARWCQRDTPGRAGVGPYDLPFLISLAARGKQLVAAVERGEDDLYRPLDGERARNVFSFSRKPADEERLLRALVRERGIPLEAWRAEASGRWREPFARMRLNRARALNIPTRPGARGEVEGS